jgi:glycosyltransferase involved in cell wall biosynthesis
MKKLRIVIVSAYYSEGMGYAENKLPKALAALGHDVHLIASTYNVYGNEPGYDSNYLKFLGPRQVAPETRMIDGYQLHRLPGRLVAGYVRIEGLASKVTSLKPDIVYSLEIASLQTFAMALLRPLAGFKLFSGTSQTMSVMKPYMRNPQGQVLKRIGYRLTRTLPSALASLTVEKCYAASPDGVEVATRFYGVPAHKTVLRSLATDTAMFHPVETEADRASRAQVRARYGWTNDDVICLYTGRFSRDKNPLLLAKAIDQLASTSSRFKALFVGEGVEREEIAKCRNVSIVPFMTHDDLSIHYRACDIAVWPKQESMSMLDAAASGVPLLVSDQMGEPGRAAGNGRTYRENDISSLTSVITELADPALRAKLGAEGRRKMLSQFSWEQRARAMETDYLASLGLPPNSDG